MTLRDLLGSGRPTCTGPAYDTVGDDLAGRRVTPLRLDAVISTDAYETPARDELEASALVAASGLH